MDHSGATQGLTQSFLDSDTDEGHGGGGAYRSAFQPRATAGRHVHFPASLEQPRHQLDKKSTTMHRIPSQHLFNSEQSERLTVDFVKANAFKLYYRDVFHTLVNLPKSVFLLLFCSLYVLSYTIFGLAYWVLEQSQGRGACISSMQSFPHALWFSVQTSSSIGYGAMAPDPDCVGVNILVMFQVLTTALMQATLLGLVYARFASPSSRAVTIRFSSVLAMFRDIDGFSHLALRIANMRRHQVLQPDVRMLLMRQEAVSSGGPIEFRYHELPLTQISGKGRLWLGVPSVMAHKIDETSPLYGLGRDEMEQGDYEFIVLLDGLDESTGTAMQARHSYFPSDIRWGCTFAGILVRAPSGNLRADFSKLDLTRLVDEQSTV